MPLPFLAAAAAGSQIAQGVMNPLFGHLTNVRNRKFSREMYGRQREDALADWAMVNEYNSPRAQMQRFQEAGLNPNLIYGQMTEAGGVRAASSSGGQAQAPQTDIGNRFMDIYSMSRTKAQADLIATQQQTELERTKLLRAQTLAALMGTNKTAQEIKAMALALGIETELRDTTIEGRKAAVDKLKVETQSIHSQIIQQWEKQPHQVKNLMMDILVKEKQMAKTDKEIAEIDQKIKLLEQEWKLNRIDEKLAEKGFNPKNPGIMKWIANLLDMIFDF